MAGTWDWNHATAADPSTWQHPNPSPGLFTLPPPQLPPLPPTFGTILDLNSPAFDFDSTLQDLNAPAFNFDQPVEGLRFLLQKELRNSDVSSLGRIVMPKKGAESHLPVLEARDGILLPMHDMVTSEVWPFRYRFWPNLKSRMYILENTAEFVKTHDLHLGDFIMIYKDDSKNRYIIRASKKMDPEQSLTPMDDEIFDSIMPDIAMASARYSDIFSPLADDTNKAFDLKYDFSADFPLSFPDERVGSSSAAAESLPRFASSNIVKKHKPARNKSRRNECRIKKI